MIEAPGATSKPSPNDETLASHKHLSLAGFNVLSATRPPRPIPPGEYAQAQLYGADIVVSRDTDNPKREVYYWARFGGRDWFADEIATYLNTGLVPADILRMRVGQPGVALFASDGEKCEDKIESLVRSVKGRLAGEEPLLGEKSAAHTTPENADELMASRHFWSCVRHHMTSGAYPQWERRVASSGQMRLIHSRAQGGCWSDSEVFHGLVLAMLMGVTEWDSLRALVRELPGRFHEFDMSWYAEQEEDFVDAELLPWFQARGVDVPVLGPRFRDLIRIARRLVAHSAEHGSAEAYFGVLVDTCFDDSIRAAAELARENGEWHLPGFDLPLAAEVLRTLGYDVARPDRHICRALAAIGRIPFRDWPERSGHGTPRPTQAGQEAVMRTMAAMAASCQVQVTYFDHVLRLACQESGAHVTNEELASWHPPLDTH